MKYFFQQKISCSKECILKNIMCETTQIKNYNVPKMPKKKKRKNNCKIKTKTKKSKQKKRK